MKTRLFTVLVAAFFVTLPVSEAAFGKTELIDELGQASGRLTPADTPDLIDYQGEEGTRANVAAATIEGFGADALPYLVEALDAGKNQYRVMVILSGIKDKRAVDAMIRQFRDPSSPVQGFAATFLKGYGDFAARDILALLKSPADVPLVAEMLADASPSRDTLERVRGMLDSKSAPERECAALLAGAWKDTASAKSLERLLFDPDPRVRKAAISGYKGLYQNAPEGLDQGLIIKLLREEKDEKNKHEALVLARNLPVASEELSVVLGDIIKNEKSPLILQGAISTAGVVKARGLVLTLIEVLETQKDLVATENAIFSLGELKAEEAVPYIVKYFTGLEKPTTHMQRQTYLTLVEIGKPVELKPFLPYLFSSYAIHESLDALLSLIEMSAAQGDKEVISALEKFDAQNKSEMLAERVRQVLRKLK
ncbi:MAG TPA: hypothetical protein VJM83_04225 [Nitrospirota bacterium]|nr:hypothetical protein [Nitrospirota bacterium]